MKVNKPTDRQTITEWMRKDNIPADEKSISVMFKMAMDFKQRRPDLPLRTAYAYAHIQYVNKLMEGKK